MNFNLYVFYLFVVFKVEARDGIIVAISPTVIFSFERDLFSNYSNDAPRLMNTFDGARLLLHPQKDNAKIIEYIAFNRQFLLLLTNITEHTISKPSQSALDIHCLVETIYQLQMDEWLQEEIDRRNKSNKNSNNNKCVA